MFWDCSLDYGLCAALVITGKLLLFSGAGWLLIVLVTAEIRYRNSKG